MNTLGYIALAAAFGALFGAIPILIKKIRKTRRYIKTCKQLGLKPEFEWSPTMKAALDRLHK